MFDNVQSVNAGGLSMIDAAGDFDDLAFLDLLLCMQESDLALGNTMQRIRDLNRRKRALMDDIALWEKAIRDSDAKKDKDWVNVPGGLPGQEDYLSGNTDEGFSLDTEELRDIPGDILKKFRDEKRKSEFLEKHGPDALPYTKEEVEAAIEAARAELESLNTNSSVMMVELQRLMNKRNEAVQFVSKTLNSSHSTAMAVINNIN